MTHHRFISRFLRSSSELFILTIISSKEEVHPYEVYQELLLQIFHSKHSQIQNFSKVLQIAKRFLNYLQESSEMNIELLEREFKGLLPKEESIDLVLNQDKELKTKTINMLIPLISEADERFELIKEDLRIWDSKTAIYQVMKELEQEGLIKVTREEIYKGRGRKIYSITEKGKIAVLNSLILFGDLFQKIFPQITHFYDLQQTSFNEHRIKLLQFFEKILSPHQIISILNKESDSPLKQLFNEMFPLIGSESILKNLISVQKVDLNLFNINAIHANYRAFYIQTILHQLRESKEYIDRKIKEVENLEL